MTNVRRPNLDKIEADLRRGVHIHYIREKYSLTRNQAAGIYWRFHFKQGREYHVNGAPR